MKPTFLILDCFVDEPACLGVPPFMATYPRYVFGALLESNIYSENIYYLTIDFLRDNDYLLPEIFEKIFLIGGAVVPGKYLGSKIGTQAEINKIIKLNPKQTFVLNNLLSHLPYEAPNLIKLKNDLEKFAYHIAQGEWRDEKRTPKEIARWATLGSQVAKKHPDWPHIICEIETFRGCPRQKHCSFCSEGLFPQIESRKEKDIIKEVDALISQGISKFRIGRQADILQYQTQFSELKQGFPKPEITPLKNLFAALKERKDSGKIETLNIDNANPGTIINFPKEASLILEQITKAITPGDTLALGIESFDPTVIKMNNLKVNSTEAIEVIKIINSIGGQRINNIPILLPGLNLIHGLKGENLRTFEVNFKTLKQIKDLGLLLKRINIRKLYPFPGTPLYLDKPKINLGATNRFEYYKQKIRREIDQTMLKKIYPLGTILKDCLILEESFNYSYGKQISSYSITTKSPLLLKKKKFYDLMIIGHQERSVLTLPTDINIKTLSKKALTCLPGISDSQASKIIIAQQDLSKEDLKKMFVRVNKEIVKQLNF